MLSISVTTTSQDRSHTGNGLGALLSLFSAKNGATRERWVDPIKSTQY